MQKTENIISFLIIIVAALVIMFINIQMASNTPKGSILYITKALPAADVKNVRLYSDAPTDANYTSLAYVNVELYSPAVSPQKEEEVINQAKTLAASIGANGLIITGIGRNEAVATYILMSKAIFSPTHS